MKHAIVALMLLVLMNERLASASEERAWDFHDIHGTTSQVAEQINTEVNRFRRRRAEMTANLGEENDRRAARVEKTLAALRATPAFSRLAARIPVLQAQLDAARLQHSPDTIQVSSALNHAKADAAAAEARAIREDAAIRQSEDVLAIYRHDLATNADALAKAEKWRAEVLESLEGDFYLTWPLEEGQVGLLMEVNDVVAVDLGSTFVSYAVQWGKVVAAKESIERHKVVGHPFRGRLSLDKPELHVAYSVEAIDDSGSAPRVRLRKDSNSDIAQLLKAINDGLLRDGSELKTGVERNRSK